MSKGRILVVDDDVFIRDVVKTVMEHEGYEVIEASNGREALEQASKHEPNLIIMDYMMPEVDGYQACLRLKEDSKLKSIPLIMLTAKDDIEDKVQLLEDGADDFIVKPFEPREVAARVKAILRRVTQSLDTNSLTKLPGEVSFSKQLEEQITQGSSFAVFSIELSEFQAFNNRYGFEHGNRVIREVAQMIKHLMENSGSDSDFVGHIGGVNFIIITKPDIVERVCTELINRFDMFISTFYSPEDKRQGYIVSRNKEGFLSRFSIMKMHIAVVTNQTEKIFSSSQVSTMLAKLKEKARLVPRSNFTKN
ncbi:MAG: response regulator [bacterium]